MQFLGKIEAKIDSKSRVFIPTVFRRVLQSDSQGQMVLRKEIYQNCLVLYPLQVWEQEVATLRLRLNRWDKSAQHIFRQFVMDAERIEMDSSGRVLIPKRSLQRVGIELEIAFLGIGDTIELWAKGKLEETMSSSEDFGVEIQRLMGGQE